MPSDERAFGATDCSNLLKAEDLSPHEEGIAGGEADLVAQLHVGPVEGVEVLDADAPVHHGEAGVLGAQEGVGGEADVTGAAEDGVCVVEVDPRAVGAVFVDGDEGDLHGGGRARGGGGLRGGELLLRVSALGAELGLGGVLRAAGGAGDELGLGLFGRRRLQLAHGRGRCGDALLELGARRERALRDGQLVEEVARAEGVGAPRVPGELLALFERLEDDVVDVRRVQFHRRWVAQETGLRGP